MPQQPDFWRTEIWHPLTVHMPLTLLILSSVFYIVWLTLGRKSRDWLHTFRVVLVLGVAGVWAAIYTGDMADGAVSRSICDPRVLKDHENFSYAVAYIFTAVLAVQSLPILGKYPAAFNKATRIITLVLLLGGSGLLAYTGHLGATLVYQQGAGVYNPTEDCKEFE